MFNRATSLGTALTAGYRSDGMRAWKQDSSSVRTYFLYDGTSPLVEMDSSGNFKSEFVYGPAGLISHSRASLPTVFFAYDERGNVQSVWRDTGSLVSSRVYDAYGNQAGGIVASATYDDPEIGYNGQAGYITDPETGLVICGHRYYDPSAGRWLNRDPIGYAGGINTYRYCGNNPVMGVDPSGLQMGDEIPCDPEKTEKEIEDENEALNPPPMMPAVAPASVPPAGPPPGVTFTDQESATEGGYGPNTVISYGGTGTAPTSGTYSVNFGATNEEAGYYTGYGQVRQTTLNQFWANGGLVFNPSAEPINSEPNAPINDHHANITVEPGSVIFTGPLDPNPAGGGSKRFPKGSPPSSP